MKDSTYKIIEKIEQWAQDHKEGEFIHGKNNWYFAYTNRVIIDRTRATRVTTLPYFSSYEVAEQCLKELGDIKEIWL